MTDHEVERDIALAEAGLDRLDRASEDGRVDEPLPTLDADDDVHVATEPGVELRDPYEDTHALEDVTDAVDGFDDAFNARDFDALLEVLSEDVEAPGLGNDRENLPAAVERLWEQRPSALLTRGWLDDRCCSVLWEPSQDGGWWRIALLHFDDVEDGTIGVVELNDDPIALEAVVTEGPDGDVEEGTRWEEWADGDGD
jgi:hypothetical protein